jgi:hypothetical protein
MGPQGETGPCCPFTGLFAGLYSALDQFAIPSGASPLLEGVTVSSVGIDTTMAGVTGEVTVNVAGVYSVTWNVAGELTPPYPAPVPSVSLALFLDGVIVPGSGNAAFLSSPDDVVTNLGNTAFITIAAGQVLKLVNTTVEPINVQANPLGTVVPIASVTMTIERISS